MKIAINEIKIGVGRRDASLKGIDELVRSISEVGLLNPITVDPDHTLIAGLHRLEAAKRLGWTEIECTVCGLERRKEIYESLHPETKAGTAQAAGDEPGYRQARQRQNPLHRTPPLSWEFRPGRWSGRCRR